jgi:hypothetical protein
VPVGDKIKTLIGAVVLKINPILECPCRFPKCSLPVGLMPLKILFSATEPPHNFDMPAVYITKVAV